MKGRDRLELPYPTKKFNGIVDITLSSRRLDSCGQFTELLANLNGRA
jgi:hypothetical protein